MNVWVTCVSAVKCSVVAVVTKCLPVSFSDLLSGSQSFTLNIKLFTN